MLPLIVNLRDHPRNAMAGDNRTPDKTIGEVRYAELKHAHDREKRNVDKPDSGQRSAKPEHPGRQSSPAGDNRTPDKMIGEVEYAQERKPSKGRAN
jgi:hypothetical protein